MKRFLTKFRNYIQFLRYFQNPIVVFALRVGLLKFPLFLYRVRNRGMECQLLARPATNTGSDLFVLREVLVEETYRSAMAEVKVDRLRIVDIGANIGAATIWFYKTHGVKEAFCFEPDPESFKLCAFNLANNNCTSAHALMLAVGSRSRRERIYSDPVRPAQTSLYRKTNSTGAAVSEIEVIAFREWLSRTPGFFDLLKCDCEGAEWEMAEDSPEVFLRFSVVVIEVHHHPAAARDVNEFPLLLSRRGFSTIRWDGHANGIYVGKLSASSLPADSH